MKITIELQDDIEIARFLTFMAQKPADAEIYRFQTANEAKELPMRDRHVVNLDLTCRTVNALLSENIITVGQLIQKTDNELLKIPNLGRKSLNEVKECLAANGLQLGMTIKEATE